jgi:hypothetical protein
MLPEIQQETFGAFYDSVAAAGGGTTGNGEGIAGIIISSC